MWIMGEIDWRREKDRDEKLKMQKKFAEQNEN